MYVAIKAYSSLRRVVPKLSNAIGTCIPMVGRGVVRSIILESGGGTAVSFSGN